MRICWLELTGNFREEPACPEEKCEQTVTPCFYKKKPQQRELGAKGPDLEQRERRVGSLQTERDRGEVKVEHRIMIRGRKIGVRWKSKS